MYSPDQRCPRCQYLLTPGATVCPNCGLALPGTPPGGNLLYPPPGQPASESIGETPPAPPGGYSAGSSGYPNVYPGSQPQGNYQPTVPAYPGSQPAYPGGQPAYPGSQPPAYPGSQPQGGFSGPSSAYPGNQPQSGYAGGVSPFPGSQTPGGFGGPPAMVATQPPPQRGGNGLKIAVIILVVLVVLGGGGGALAYFLTRPKPVIDVTSQYPQDCTSATPTGGTPAGATGTKFHITGQKFSSNSAITILLDGDPAPGAPSVVSDANGTITADLTVTDAWRAGTYTITARDAGGYKTQDGKAITIVTPGEAGTPGPNSAPPDCKSFSLDVQVQRTDAVTGDQLNTLSTTLQITGKPDPAGGTVCSQYDDGQPQTSDGSDADGNTYTETFIFQCSGTYKNGHITYKETATSDKIVFSDGFTCTANTPYVYANLDGSFSSSTNVSGNYTSDTVTYICSSGGPQVIDSEKGTFSGSLG